MLRSVDSECAGRVIEPRNCDNCGCRRCSIGGRQHRIAARAWRGEPAGVEEQGMYGWGSPRNLGGPVISTEKRNWRRGSQARIPLARTCSVWWMREQTTGARWYGQTKATKCGRKGGRKSELPIVPAKPGNGPERTRWREGEAR
jgi:hypothetical protein